jgi:ParB family chromosome partitioning protein
MPAVIREVGTESSLEIALIENLQREDLNPIEEAQAFEKLIVDLGLTQEEVANRVGKSRATITNTLRLLRLPAEVQAWISENQLSTGHAKALLSLAEPGAILDAARKVIQGTLSVRQAEALVSRSLKGDPKKDSAEKRDALDPNVSAAIHALELALGTKVTIQDNGGKGRIELHFFSFEEMNRLYEALIRSKF